MTTFLTAIRPLVQVDTVPVLEQLVTIFKPLTTVWTQLGPLLCGIKKGNAFLNGSRNSHAETNL